MTAPSPSSSDGSPLPPRHRPNVGNLAKDTTEQDLWAFDELPTPEENPEKIPRLAGPVVPVPRFVKPFATDTSKSKDEDGSAATHESVRSIAEDIKINRSKPRPLIARQVMPSSDFDDLDHWDDMDSEVLPELPVAPLPTPMVSPESVGLAPESDRSLETPDVPAEETLPGVPPLQEEEFSVPKKSNDAPISWRPRLALTSLERAGLGVFLGLMVIGGGLLYYHVIHPLSTGSAKAVKNDFPLKGKYLSVNAADSYWRAPSTSGTVQDTVRRGTVLIPEVVLKPQGGPAAIRLFFRNSEGDLVGDAVTRSVHQAAEIRVAATAGFEDVGMHAAYRTGQTKPWTVEVREAPSENSPVQDFKKLFEMDISTDRR